MQSKWIGLAALAAVACLTVRGDIEPKRIAATYSADGVVGENLYITDFDIVEVTMAGTEFEVQLWTEVQVPRQLRLVVSPMFFGNPLDPLFAEFWVYCDQSFPIFPDANRRLKRYRFTFPFSYQLWKGYLVLVDEEGNVTSWTVPVSAYTN